jgi:hypothetical protein
MSATRRTETKARKARPASRRAETKTRPTGRSVEAFLAAVPDERRRRDARTALALLKRVTGLPPRMWGPSIVGFGSYHYRYESGREGDMCLAGFSPRATATVFYLLAGLREQAPLLARLGPHGLGQGCLYVRRLEDVDLGVLERIVAGSVASVRRAWPAAAAPVARSRGR